MIEALRKMLGVLGDPEQPVLRVLVSGAVGGALGVIAGSFLGELTNDWWRIIAPSAALGAGAAFAAVFVLLGIKTEDVHRCCGIALLAGFFWQPVFDAGKEYLLNTDARETEKQVVKDNAKLEDTNKQLANSPTNAQLATEAGLLAQNLTRDSADLRRSSLKSRAQSTVAQTIDVLGATAEKQPPVAANALLNVAETAIRSGNRTVAEKARSQVERVPFSASAYPELQLRKLEVMKAAPPSR